MPPEETLAARQRAVVGRQPIVDRSGAVYGFELLHRPTPSTPLTTDGDRKTAEVVLNTLTVGLDALAGDRLVFVNAERPVLTGELALGLPPRRTVIEVLETIDLDEEVVAGVRRLVAEGYRIALDDFVWRAGAEELLESVAVVKIDVLSTPEGEVRELLTRLAGAKPLLLAEKVESPADVQRACEAGFDLFQGYGVERPTLVAAHALAPTSVARAELGLAVLRDELDFREIEQVLRHEPELTAQMMHLASLGAAGGLRRPLRTIREALVYLGTIRIRQWIALTMLSGHPTAGVDALARAVTRARTCELLARRRRLPPDFAFTAGLLSSLDFLLGCEVSELASVMSLDEELRAAAFDHAGRVGAVVGEVVDYERAVRYDVASEVDEQLDELAAHAFQWALPFLRALP